MKIRRHLWQAGLALAFVALLPVNAAAQTQVDETRRARGDVRIEFGEIVVGKVRVVGWDRDEMQIRGTLGDDVEGLEIEGDEGGWEIDVLWDDEWDWDHDHDSDDRRDRNRERDRRRNRDRDVDVDLVVSVPHGANLDIEGVTLNVEIVGVDGPVSAETITGTIDYSGRSRHLSLTTITGTVRVESEEIDRLDVETVQGQIEFTGGFASGARASFEAVGGSIILRIPGDTSASFDIETMTGGIENDFGQEPVRESRWVPSSELRFSLGNGSARVSVETLQGRVQIRRQ